MEGAELGAPSLQMLRRDEETADVVIALDDGSLLPAHRSVLALASPVFRRCLYGPMKLPADQMFRMRGKDPATVEGLLAYCYGLPRVTPETAIRLLQIADEFCVDGLKAWCDRWIVTNLDDGQFDDEAAANAVRWACEYRCPALQRHLPQRLVKLLHDHLDAGELEAARALAASHASFAPSLAASMKQIEKLLGITGSIIFARV